MYLEQEGYHDVRNMYIAKDWMYCAAFNLHTSCWKPSALVLYFGLAYKYWSILLQCSSFNTHRDHTSIDPIIPPHNPIIQASKHVGEWVLSVHESASPLAKCRIKRKVIIRTFMDVTSEHGAAHSEGHPSSTYLHCKASHLRFEGQSLQGGQDEVGLSSEQMSVPVAALQP